MGLVTRWAAPQGGRQLISAEPCSPGPVPGGSLETLLVVRTGHGKGMVVQGWGPGTLHSLVSPTTENGLPPTSAMPQWRVLLEDALPRLSQEEQGPHRLSQVQRTQALEGSSSQDHRVEGEVPGTPPPRMNREACGRSCVVPDPTWLLGLAGGGRHPWQEGGREVRVRGSVSAGQLSFHATHA